MICFYLFQNNYYIKEFPTLLHTPMTLNEFANDHIRAYLIKNRNADPSRVPWQERRNLLNDLQFKVSEEYYLQNKLNDSFRMISTRNAEFHQMADGEKLKEIANMIEYLLKNNKSFSTVDTRTVYYDFITNEDIKLYRKKIQSFRHSTNENLTKRKNLLQNKDFLISYGLAILAPLMKASEDKADSTTYL